MRLRSGKKTVYKAPAERTKERIRLLEQMLNETNKSLQDYIRLYENLVVEHAQLQTENARPRGCLERIFSLF